MAAQRLAHALALPGVTLALPFPRQVGSGTNKETIIVKLARTDLNVGFGFTLDTPLFEDGGHVITKVSDERETEDLIRVADVIVSLNGAPATSLKHDDLIAAIVGATEIEMAIVRDVVKGQTIKPEHGAHVDGTTDETSA